MTAVGGAQVLVLLGAAIFGALGSLHLAYTFFSEKLLPYDRAVIDAMKSTTLTLTRQTTIWDAWVGFNAAGFAYAWLAHQYWFRTPFICVAIATACFLAAFVLLHLV